MKLLALLALAVAVSASPLLDTGIVPAAVDVGATLTALKLQISQNLLALQLATITQGSNILTTTLTAVQANLILAWVPLVGPVTAGVSALAAVAAPGLLAGSLIADSIVTAIGGPLAAPLLPVLTTFNNAFPSLIAALANLALNPSAANLIAVFKAAAIGSVVTFIAAADALSAVALSVSSDLLSSSPILIQAAYALVLLIINTGHTFAQILGQVAKIGALLVPSLAPELNALAAAVIQFTASNVPLILQIANNPSANAAPLSSAVLASIAALLVKNMQVLVNDVAPFVSGPSVAIVGAIGGVANAAAALITAIGSGALKLVGSLAGNLGNLAAGLTRQIGLLITAVVTVLTSLLGLASGSVTPLEFLGIVGQQIVIVALSIPAVIALIVQAIKNAGDAVAAVALSLIAPLTSLAASAIAGVSSVVKALIAAASPAAIVAAAQAAITSLANTAKNTDTLVSGLNSLIINGVGTGNLAAVPGLGANLLAAAPSFSDVLTGLFLVGINTTAAALLNLANQLLERLAIIQAAIKAVLPA